MPLMTGPAFFKNQDEGGDPFFSNVVLMLLNGTGDATDESSYGHTASITGGITFEAANPHPVFGTSLRTNGGGGWVYSSATEWRYGFPCTLDFSLYFDTADTAIWFGCSDFSRYLSATGSTSAAMLLQGKYGGISAPSPFVFSTWYDCRYVSDGTNKAFYINGARASVNVEGAVPDGSDVDFNVIMDIGLTPRMRLAGIRYTQGVARNDPNDPTCPVPSALWPTSA